MIKKSYILTGLLAIGSSLSAQVVIERLHVADNGFKATFKVDTAGFAPLSLGPNQIWDLSSQLKGTKIYNIMMGANSWYPGHEKFPTSNHCITRTDQDSSFQYLKISQSELSNLGTYAITNGDTTLENIAITLLKFPLAYGNSWNEQISFPEDPVEAAYDLDGSGPLPFIDSTRVNIIFDSKTSVTGWGKLMLPAATHNDILQVRAMRILSISLQIKVGGFWITPPTALLDSLDFDSPKDTTYQMFYWSNNATNGWPLLIYEYDNATTKVANAEWMMANAVTGVSGKMKSRVELFPNPAFDMLQISGLQEKQAAVALYDYVGKKCVELPVSNNCVSLSGVPSGIYMLELKGVDGAILKTLKLVKE